ncbi:MAG TPA: hypothetical protein VHZ53_11075 [Steroidobacteraceae bacterium]|nr:hypothetical protein [Steroidobacteraceae bacterium]
MSVDALGQLKFMLNEPSAAVVTLMPTWTVDVPTAHRLTVAPISAEEPTCTVPVREFEPTPPLDEEDPPDDELLLLEDEPPDDEPLDEDEVPPPDDDEDDEDEPPDEDDDELLLDELPPDEDEEEDEDEELPPEGGALPPPPPPPPPHAASASVAISTEEFRASLSISGTSAVSLDPRKEATLECATVSSCNPLQTPFDFKTRSTLQYGACDHSRRKNKSKRAGKRSTIYSPFTVDDARGAPCIARKGHLTAFDITLLNL